MGDDFVVFNVGFKDSAIATKRSFGVPGIMLHNGIGLENANSFLNTDDRNMDSLTKDGEMSRAPVVSIRFLCRLTGQEDCMALPATFPSRLW